MIWIGVALMLYGYWWRKKERQRSFVGPVAYGGHDDPDPSTGGNRGLHGGHVCHRVDAGDGGETGAVPWPTH